MAMALSLKMKILLGILALAVVGAAFSDDEPRSAPRPELKVASPPAAHEIVENTTGDVAANQSTKDGPQGADSATNLTTFHASFTDLDFEPTVESVSIWLSRNGTRSWDSEDLPNGHTWDNLRVGNLTFYVVFYSFEGWGVLGQYNLTLEPDGASVAAMYDPEKDRLVVMQKGAGELTAWHYLDDRKK
jgi:hypothetical protein